MTLKQNQNAAATRREDEERGAVPCGQRTFKWEILVAVVIHPVRVAIVEAVIWLQKPVSAKEVEMMFEEPGEYSVSVIACHMRSLAERGAIEETGHRWVRGARETFYFLSPSMTAGENGAAR